MKRKIGLGLVALGILVMFVGAGTSDLDTVRAAANMGEPNPFAGLPLGVLGLFAAIAGGTLVAGRD